MGFRRTLTKPAMPLVVQDALDTMGSSPVISSAFTPITYVGMLPLPGAVITTFLAPAVMCLPAPSSSMNTPESTRRCHPGVVC